MLCKSAQIADLYALHVTCCHGDFRKRRGALGSVRHDTVRSSSEERMCFRVLWFHPSNSSAALSSGLWKIVIKKALFCVVAMVGSTRKGKELVFECNISLTQNGVRFFVFASIVLMTRKKSKRRLPLMILLISLKTVNVFGLIQGKCLLPSLKLLISICDFVCWSIDAVSTSTATRNRQDLVEI